MLEAERKQIVEFGKQMSAAGLSRGTSGNLSMYDPASVILRRSLRTWW